MVWLPPAPYCQSQSRSRELITVHIASHKHLQYGHLINHTFNSYLILTSADSVTINGMTCQVLTKREGTFCGQSVNTDIRGGSYLNYSNIRSHSKF